MGYAVGSIEGRCSIAYVQDTNKNFAFKCHRSNDVSWIFNTHNVWRGMGRGADEILIHVEFRNSVPPSRSRVLILLVHRGEFSVGGLQCCGNVPKCLRNICRQRHQFPSAIRDICNRRYVVLDSRLMPPKSLFAGPPTLCHVRVQFLVLYRSVCW